MTDLFSSDVHIIHQTLFKHAIQSEVPNTLFELLTTIIELQTQADSFVPILQLNVDRFVEAIHEARACYEQASKNADIDVESVATFTYIILVAEIIYSSWDSVYVHFRNWPAAWTCLLRIKELIDTFPLQGAFNTITNGWTPGELILDALLILAIWRGSEAGIKIRSDLLITVASFLRFQQPFLCVFLAAGCLKRDELIDQLMEHSEYLGIEQVACLEWMDSFHYLPGSSWGG